MVSALKKNPQQSRSRETQARLLAAARTLAEERDWHDISMAQIAREARSSIGSLYARFESKQALFDHLDQEYAQELEALLSEIADLGVRAEGLRDFIKTLVSRLVRFHRKRRGLIRALVLAARIERPVGFENRTRQMNVAGGKVLGVFAKFDDEITHSNKAEAASWALFTILTMIRERILFPESVSISGSPDDDRLATEVIHVASAYLTMAEVPI